jgi:hypothetical protein
MQSEVMSGLGMLRRLVVKLGPYFMLEALLPGGTLLALLLFLYRGRKVYPGSDMPGKGLGEKRAAATTPARSRERRMLSTNSSACYISR